MLFLSITSQFNSTACILENDRKAGMCAGHNSDQLPWLGLKINYLHFGIHDVRAN